jgi:uncharacterized phage infection (PIP) family protein YhgE
MNAAVEAARAGEHGRGFAVVASEVRNLAGRSATAAREIKALIQDSVRKVNDGSELVTRSGETLGQIVASIKTVSDLVAEIAGASREQSQGIEQINRAVLQMDEFTQTNGSLVAQAAAASQTMAQRAGELKAIMERYQLDDSVDPAADSTTKVARPAQAATPVTDDSPATGRTLERRRTTRPWTAGGAARATVAKTAPPGPRFAKVADDDTDWKEF